PRVRSNVLRPVTKAPVVVLVSRRYSAVCGATLNTISVPGSLYSVSPPMYHAKSRSPPLPIGASGPSFGPAINPSSDVACPVRTFPMASFSYSVHPPLRGSQLSWALLPDVRMGSDRLERVENPLSGFGRSPLVCNQVFVDRLDD